MKVYVVMGNDFPHSVWSTEELADAEIERAKTEHTESWIEPQHSPLIRWRHYEFELDG